MKAILSVADSVHATLKSAGSVAAVTRAVPRAVTHDPTVYYDTDFDTSADAPALQIAAAGRGQGRYAPRKPPPRTGAARSGGQAKPQGREGEPHPDGPPPNACNTHYKYGKAAFTCRKKDSCPWAHLANK